MHDGKIRHPIQQRLGCVASLTATSQVLLVSLIYWHVSGCISHRQERTKLIDRDMDLADSSEPQSYPLVKQTPTLDKVPGEVASPSIPPTPELDIDAHDVEFEGQWFPAGYVRVLSAARPEFDRCYTDEGTTNKPGRFLVRFTVERDGKTSHVYSDAANSESEAMRRIVRCHCEVVRGLQFPHRETPIKTNSMFGRRR